MKDSVPHAEEFVLFLSWKKSHEILFNEKKFLSQWNVTL